MLGFFFIVPNFISFLEVSRECFPGGDRSITILTSLHLSVVYGFLSPTANLMGNCFPSLLRWPFWDPRLGQTLLPTALQAAS